MSLLLASVMPVKWALQPSGYNDLAISWLSNHSIGLYETIT
jgi:hypothetical protein